MDRQGLAGPVNAMTVDVEEYFHPNSMDAAVDPARWDSLAPRVEANTLRMLDMLALHGVRATFFVLGWVAERYPRLVTAIAASGHEVACHGYAHRLAYKLGPERFREDAMRARNVLEDQLGARVAGFRAASWSVVTSTPWALDTLIELGFTYDSSVFPIRHDLYGMEDFGRFPIRLERDSGSIVEIPATTVRWLGRNWPVGGGGYLRILPLSLTCRALRRIHRRDGAPAMVYTHPWELDVDQPRLSASAKSRFRQYVNLHRTEPRLRALFRQFRFAPIREAYAASLADEACNGVSMEATGPRRAKAVLR